MSAITLFDVRAFIRAQAWAIEASVSEQAAPQAAVIGIAVNDSLEMVFDTLSTSQKHRNLRANAQVALVVGWDSGITVQIQGHADQPIGAELDELKRTYFARFPDGRDREHLPDIAYWRIRPNTVRYSDFNTEPPQIVVWDAADIISWKRNS